MTKGGLRKSDLKVSKSGKIVSARRSRLSAKAFEKNGLANYKYA